MSDKPEKIWISDLGIDDLEKGLDVVQVSKIPDEWMKHEYIRADLANSPSEVYDRIQGYIRVIQEKDALLDDQAKPSEAIELLKGFIDSYGDIDIIQRLREKTQIYLTKINK